MTVADPGIFQRGGSTLKVGFQRGGSTIIWGFQRGVPLSKCVILTLFLQNFLTKGGVPTPGTPPLDPPMYDIKRQDQIDHATNQIKSYRHETN
jgi:hypothetical protein